MLQSHYSPGLPLEVRDRVTGPGTARTAHIVFGRPAGEHSFSLSETGDLEEAARRLFTVLRLVADGGYHTAVAEWVPERGLGRAINDRLRRAAN
jgi:L-threonylcarbamoyladenylate synthase